MIKDDDLTGDLAHADRDTIYRRLQEDLLRQIQLCARNQQIYAQMEATNNNIKHTNEYKVLEQHCAHDLEKLRQCFQQGLEAPLFHYERRQMNVIQINNDLGDNDLEVSYRLVHMRILLYYVVRLNFIGFFRNSQCVSVHDSLRSMNM